METAGVMPPPSLPALKLEAPPSRVPTAELAAGEHLRVNSDLAQAINLVGRVHPALDRDTGDPTERATLDKALQETFDSLYAACDAKAAASQTVETAKKGALDKKIQAAVDKILSPLKQAAREKGEDPDKIKIPEETEKQIANIRASTKLEPSDLAAIDEESIIAQYHDESTGIYYQVRYARNPDGSIQKDKDGNPIFEKDHDTDQPAIETDEEGKKREVDLKRAFGVLRSELENISKLTNPDDTPTADALEAERLLDTFVQTDDGNLKLFTQEEMAEIKAKREEREGGILTETIKKAQEVISEEYQKDVLNSEFIQPNKTIMDLLLLIKDIDPNNPYARHMVYMGLNMAERQLTTQAGLTEIERTGRIAALHQQADILRILPGQKDNPLELLRKLASCQTGIKPEYWDEELKKVTEMVQQGQDAFPEIENVIATVFQAASQTEQGNKQLEELLNSTIPKDKQENMFSLDKIFGKLKSHPKYQEFKQKNPDKTDKVLRARIQGCHNFMNETHADWKARLIGLMMASQLLQLLQKADQEAMMAGTGQGGGEPPG